eukprot:TRINITY_DN1325_c0_g2_i1.p1 TRINITY_DN1325_c0_g2~~TRINITY_DN1325_c0_g2_i1.p1  ORF type:complete len:385 (+),score=84.73 TRINITY_DN1325_c0_g2_i1:74-1228(+)
MMRSASALLLLTQPYRADADICDSIHNLQCNGNDIAKSFPVGTHEECCSACQQTAGCNAWTWNWQYGKHCYLKSGCDSQTQNPSYHSGMSSGPSPPSPPPSPPSPSSSGKAGIAQHLEHASQADKDAVARSGIAWHYNWAMNGPSQSGLEFVPQVWGKDSINHLSSLPSSEALLGFNEPNMKSNVGGSDMSVDTVVSLWPQVEAAAKAHGVRTLVGPCVAQPHLFDWYGQFFAKCSGCRVDAVCFHNYNCDMGSMQNYVNGLKKWNKPIWITEIACANNPGGSKDANRQCSYMKQLIPYLMGEPSVAKFAWFSYDTSYTGQSALYQDGSLTSLGRCYDSLIGGVLSGTEMDNTTTSFVNSYVNATGGDESSSKKGSSSETLVIV